MKFYFKPDYKTFDDLGRIVRVILPVLGKPTQLTTTTEAGKQVSKTWGWEVKDIETFIKVYETCKKAGILPINSELFSFPFILPNEFYMSSFLDSDDPAEWKRKNDQKKAAVEEIKKKRAAKQSIWSEQEKIREVNTALTGQCSMHHRLRRYIFALGKCWHCEKIKEKRKLPNIEHAVFYANSSWHKPEKCERCKELAQQKENAETALSLFLP